MRGIVIATDKKQDWMLPWFLSNLRKYNPVLPVTHFKIESEGWFYKPKAFINSPYEETLWLDVDCEVRGSVDAIFESITPNKMSGVIDAVYRKQINTGVLCCDKSFSVDKWLERCDRRIDRSDQEAFLVSIPKSNVVILPEKYNNVRLAPVCADCVIRHWTGASGKKIIREQMNAKS